MKTPESEDGVQYFNGKPYRAGYLAPSRFDRMEAGDKREIRRAMLENTISVEKELYHYTSLSGFKGIVEAKGFWASDNRYLNDAEEVSHGRDLTVQILNHKIKRTNAPFRQVLKVVRDSMLEEPKTGQLVVCFSKARDSLEQWRGYGEGIGVCIRIGSGHETSDEVKLRPIFFGPEQLPHDVKYQDRSKMVTLLSVIQRYAEEYATDRQVMKDCWPVDHDTEYAKSLVSNLEYHTVTFKNDAFSEEKEVRLVIPHSYADKYNGGLQFRISRFGLIPYICTGNRKGITGLLPIQEVIVGPSENQQLIAESVASFLEHQGYPSILITLSKVPFRN